MPQHSDLSALVVRFFVPFEPQRFSAALLTLWVRAGLDCVQKLHVTDIVDVDLLLKNDHQSSAIKFDAKYRSGEEQLANRRLPLEKGAGGEQGMRK